MWAPRLGCVASITLVHLFDILLDAHVFNLTGTSSIFSSGRESQYRSQLVSLLKDLPS